MTDTPLAPPPQDSPPTPVRLSPSEMYDVGGQFIFAQNRVTEIMVALHADLSQYQQALGGDNSAMAFAAKYNEAAAQVFPGFVRLHQLIGAIGEGLTVSAENHRQADERSTPPGHPTSQPFPKRTRWAPPGILDVPPITGESRRWLPEPLQDIWPSYEDSKATPVVQAYIKAQQDTEDLFGELYGKLRSHLENNDSDDIRALDEFFDRVAGHGGNTMFTTFPNLLNALGNAINEYCGEVAEHLHDLREAINKALEDLGVMILIDAILAAVTDGISFGLIQPEADAVLVRATPGIIEVCTDLSAAAAAAAGAANTAADLFATASRDTPNPNIEVNEAGKLGDEIGSAAAKFNPEEQKIADRLEAEGHRVAKIPETNDARTADALVDGRPVEFKTIMKESPDSSTIKNVLNESKRRGGQARDVLIDAEGSPLSRDEALRGIKRFLGANPGYYDSVTIWLQDGSQVVWP